MKTTLLKICKQNKKKIKGRDKKEAKKIQIKKLLDG